MANFIWFLLAPVSVLPPSLVDDVSKKAQNVKNMSDVYDTF